MPTDGDWQTDNTLRELRFNQTRLSSNLTFGNFTHGTTDSTANPYFEIVVSNSGDYSLTFSSVTLLEGTIPFALTNNTGVGNLYVPGT